MADLEHKALYEYPEPGTILACTVGMWINCSRRQTLSMDRYALLYRIGDSAINAHPLF